MSQEPEATLITTRRQRTTRRRGGNRPVLVTTPETASTERETGTLATHTEPLAEQSAEVAVAEVQPQPARASRLPRFFSKVEKEETEPAPQEDEVVKARLARATRGTSKSAATKASDQVETKASESKPRAAAKSAPPRLFKTRHFLGAGIYLFGAQLVLPYEYQLSKALGIEQVFFTFPLFGHNYPVDTSLLLNLATLVIVLLVLVKLDLLPSTLTARTAAESRTRELQARQRAANSSAPKAPQPAIKQGVKGEADDLYLAYRQGQRRDKKR